MTNFCKSCGAALEPGARFCKSCGAQAEAQAVQKSFCPSCGRELSPGAAFCPDCGAKLQPASQAAPASNRPPQSVPGPASYGRAPSPSPDRVPSGAAARRPRKGLVILILLAVAAVFAFTAFKYPGFLVKKYEPDYTFYLRPTTPSAVPTIALTAAPAASPSAAPTAAPTQPPSSDSGWVMIYEKATQTPDYESPSGIYYDTYSWEKDEAAGLIRAYSTNEAKPDDPTRHYQCTQFETTCTLPPKSGAPGEKVLFDISAALLETIGDEYSFSANCTVQWAAPGKEPNIAGRLCLNVLDEGADWDYHPCGGDASVGGGSVNEGSSCTVYWIFPNNPQPGDQISVYFMTNAVQIEWCYEYQG